MLVDVIKSTTSYTTKIRRLKKVVVVEGENVEVLLVGKNEDIDPDVDTATEKRRKEVHVTGRTRSSC